MDSAPELSPEQWYANFDGVNQGPVDEATFKRWIDSNKVASDTLVWRQGMQDWIAAEIVRPDWFSRTSRRTDTTAQVASNGQSEFQWLASELLQTRAWVQFLAITGLVIGTLAVIASVAWFFLVATRDGSGPVKVMAVVVSLVQLATAIAWFFGSLFLLNYSNRLSVLKYRLDAQDIQLAMKSLNRVWKFTGIVVLIWLIITSLLFSMIYLLGLSIPLPG